MKKLLSLVLTLALMCGLLPTAYAASNEAIGSADILNALGLFNGTGTDANGNPIYDLDKIPTRNQAVIMLVRLLGKEEEALSGDWELPFADVAKGSTAYPYIGYAYANGLTNGTSATTYNGTNPIKANQYITFVLRALGYESGKDFQVSTAWEFSDEIGLTDGRYDENTKTFLRSDIAIISASALECPLKNSNKRMFDVMQENGTVSAAAVLSIPSKEVSFTYHKASYKEKYVQSASVKKIGDRYQFEFKMMPGHFSAAYIFPSGYHNDGDNKYVKFISLESTPGADIAEFSVSEEFLFRNPVDRTYMFFGLKPILTAFPDDFKFYREDEKRILVGFETDQLPR